MRLSTVKLYRPFIWIRMSKASNIKDKIKPPLPPPWRENQKLERGLDPC